MMSFLSFLLPAALLPFFPSVANAYIPAAPVNGTKAVIANSTHIGDGKLEFVWLPGTYSATVSQQLVASANQSDFFPSLWSNGGVDRGALVHFSEDLIHGNESTTTPWIAFISCDSNSTNMSEDDDIFTLARDRGAMAALLYSNRSEGCQIEQEYLTPPYEKVLDVFTTHNKNDALVIEDHFEQNCDPAFQNFAPSLLSISFNSVTSLLNGTKPTSNTYVVAILTAFNATTTVPFLQPTESTTTTTGSSSSGGGSKPGTSLAMIILYCITGVITILFIVVLTSGAVRAMRHPERYGPRAGRRDNDSYPYNYDDPRYGGPDGNAGGAGGGVPQTRTAGLAAAIVDTFPIIKFVSKKSRNSVGAGGALVGPESKKLAEEDSFEMASSRDPHPHHLPSTSSSSSSSPLEADSTRAPRDDVRSSYHSMKETIPSTTFFSRQGLADTQQDEEDDFLGPVLRSGHAAAIERSISSVVGEKVVKKDDEERHDVGESCAICLDPFEEGDNLRVLPCEGHHQFHQDCIDNWLLDISGNCPLCRKDFSLAPTSSTSSLPLTADPPALAVAAGNPLATRINRYLTTVRSSRRASRQLSANADGNGGASTTDAMRQANGLSSLMSGGAMR